MSKNPIETFEKIKYKLVINNELEKIYINYEKSMYGIEYRSNFSTKKLLEILNAIKYIISFVNSKDITLDQLKEKFEFVKELNKILGEAK